MKPWKKGALIGGAIGLLSIAVLFLVGSDKAYILPLFYPDFLIVGAVIGYLYGKYFKTD